MLKPVSARRKAAVLGYLHSVAKDSVADARQIDIAEMIGTTTGTVSRALHHLERAGLIKIETGYMRIHYRILTPLSPSAQGGK